MFPDRHIGCVPKPIKLPVQADFYEKPVPKGSNCKNKMPCFDQTNTCQKEDNQDGG